MGIPQEESTSYLIAMEDTSVSDRRQFRQNAIDSAVQKAINAGIAQSRSQLTVREFERVRDAGAGTTQWLTAALAVVATEYSCFAAVAAPTLASNKVAVFYGMSLNTIPINISLLRFRLGGAAGNMIGEFDSSKIQAAEQMIGYFSTPMLIGPTDIFAASVMCVVASLVAENVVLYGFTLEPKGQTIL